MMRSRVLGHLTLSAKVCSGACPRPPAGPGQIPSVERAGVGMAHEGDSRAVCHAHARRQDVGHPGGPAGGRGHARTVLARPASPVRRAAGLPPLMVLGVVCLLAAMRPARAVDEVIDSVMYTDPEIPTARVVKVFPP